MQKPVYHRPWFTLKEYKELYKATGSADRDQLAPALALALRRQGRMLGVNDLPPQPGTHRPEASAKNLAPPATGRSCQCLFDPREFAGTIL